MLVTLGISSLPFESILSPLPPVVNIHILSFPDGQLDGIVPMTLPSPLHPV